MNSFGQINKVHSISPDKNVYWFSVKTKIKLGLETKKERYFLNSTGKSSKSGMLLGFEKDLFRCLIKGKQILIGPFNDEAYANQAFQFYRLAKITEESMEQKIIHHKNTSDIEKYYWFFFKFKSNRKHPPMLERTAVRVTSGTLTDFRQVLWEGVFFKQIAIGPFPSKEEAKLAKRLYRLEED